MVRIGRSLLVCLAFIFCSSFIIVLWILQSPQLNQYAILKSYHSINSLNTGPRVILLWNDFFGARNWNLPGDVLNVTYFESSKCAVTNCIITSNREYLKAVEKYDAVVFHTAQLFPVLQPTPSRRNAEQLYVFAQMEPPAETKHTLKDEGNFYNLTMTYRLDSDIVWPYAYVQDIESGAIVAPSTMPTWRHPPKSFGDEKLLRTVQNKGKLSAWFSSHCETYSKREDLIASLQKYISVDVYGKCGNFSCPRGSPKCDEMLDTDYKFHFVLENSLCTDYVSEKIFNAMKRQIIPIVFGAVDFNRFLPPHSYIDAERFKTSKDLADYLIHLDSHPEEYMKYFWWRKFYKFVHKTPFCDLCEKLNNYAERQRYQVYANIEEWWFGNTCRSKTTMGL